MFGVGVLAVVIGLVLTLSPALPGAVLRPTRAEAPRPALAVVFLTAAAVFALLTAITPDYSVATSTRGPATRSTRAPSATAAPTPTPGLTRQ